VLLGFDEGAELVWRLLKIVFAAVTVLATILGLIPIFLGISIHTPSPLPFRDEIFPPFEISNDYVLAVHHVTYQCIVIHSALGASLEGGRVFEPKQDDRTLDWRDSTTCHCEEVVHLKPGAELNGAVVALRVTYCKFPWIFGPSVEQRAFEAIMDDRRQIVRWTPYP
jgi:hypothetical protein